MLHRASHEGMVKSNSSFPARKLNVPSTMHKIVEHYSRSISRNSILYANDRRSTDLARSSRDLVAATEIPAISAISLMELSCTC